MQQPLDPSPGPKFWMDGKSIPIYNLSAHGFYVSGNGSTPGSELKGVLEFDEGQSLPLRVRVRSSNPDKTHYTFLDLSLKDQQELGRMLTSEVAYGEMLNDMSYDQIAGGVAQSDPPHRPPPGGRPSSTRKARGVVAAVLLLVGILGITTAVWFYFRSQLTIPIYNAVLLGNLASVKAPSDGIVEQILVKEGAVVTKGEPLFRIVDQKVEHDYVNARAELAGAMIERDQSAEAVKTAERQTAVLAQALGEDLKLAEAAIRMAEAEVRRAQSLAERLKPLADRRVIVKEKLDEAVMTAEHAKSALELRQLELKRLSQRERVLRESDVLLVGDRLDETLPRARAHHATFQARVTALEAQVAHLEALRKGFTVTATGEGVVYATYQHPGSFVKSGSEVLAISTSEENWAIGHVHAKKALKVFPGQKVRVHLPSMDIAVEGRVAAIGHRGVYSQNGWNPDFRADPTLVPIKVTLPDIPEKAPAGLRLAMAIQLDHQWPWESKSLPSQQPALEAMAKSKSADFR